MARYKRQELDRAVALVIGGAKGTDVARDTQIPYNTLMNNVRATKAGKTRKRMGPPTALPDTCELDLVAWIGAMQRDGYPPDRQAIMVKATQLLRKIDATRTTLSSGWYKRFRNRFPMLTKRVAQVISHARNSVDEQGVTRLFGSITKTIAENKITADRIYNMDETAFVSRKKSETGALHTISRAAALRIASAAWKDRILPANAVAGFKATGLWPLSKVQMMKRFNLFKEGGVPKSYLEAFWIERREALRSEMLRLPAKSKKKTSGRKTIDVGGRILTVELLSEIDKSKEDRQAASMQKAALQKKRGKRGKNGKRITLSKVALKWAAIATTYGLKPLPSGQIRSIDNGDNQVVV
ncbi:hypothetical protein DYB36_006026 [Aphanomyces astaci]|uniref:HTH CENPB-type domain-containing protein n=1 Tax=Aphanomyces astaci TaxID=112090 RepID=A0A396ZTW6_APHAT|nr:hypothetical protein DYB36_006026 [Aphanomyces astaci]